MQRRLSPTRSRARVNVPPLAAMATTPLGLFSFAMRLANTFPSSNWAGNLFTVRRASDNALLQVGFNPRTGLLDRAALRGFCGSSDGFVRALADQSGNNWHLEQATNASQPKIYDGTTQAVLVNGSGVPAAVFTGTLRLFRSDAMGLSGDPAITVGYAGDIDTAAVPVWSIGGTSAGRIFNAGMFSVATLDPYVSISGSQRQFGEVEDPRNDHYHVARKAASTTVANYTCRQNGSDLAQTAVSGGGNALNITGTTRTALGSFDGSTSTSCQVAMLAFYNANLSGNDLALLEEALRRHVP